MESKFRNVKGIIFDMDGVLFDSTGCHERAYRAVLQEIGINDFDYSAIAGMRTDEAIQKLLHENRIPGEENLIEKLTQKKREKALILLEKEGKIAQGCQRLLSRLREKYLLALASSASPQTVEFFLKKSHTRDIFQAILDGSQVRRAKPDPEIYLSAQETLRIPPENCIVIEDALSGIQAARQAGLPCIGIDPKKTKEKVFLQEGAAVVVSEVKEIAPLLL